MKSIGKAAELVSKAVGALRGKAGVLRARLLFLASPRRRAAVLAGISRHIRALTTPRHHHPCHDKAKAAAQRQQHYDRRRGSMPCLAAPADGDKGVVVSFCLPHQQLPVVPAASLLPAVLVVQDEVDGDDGSGGGWCTAADSDWTLALRSLFDDDHHHQAGGGGHRGGDDCLAGAIMDGLDFDDDDETSVIDVIRRRREGDGQEFRIEDEIDRAAELYITKVRRRISAQLEELER